MNRAICLNLALAAVGLLLFLLQFLLQIPVPAQPAGITAARFAVPGVGAEPQKWQYELQKRCAKRAVVQAARPQLHADQAWAYERWVREGGLTAVQAYAFVQEYLGHGPPGGDINHGRDIVTYQNLYRATLDYRNHYSADSYYNAMLDKCFYLQIAPQN